VNDVELPLRGLEEIRGHGEKTYPDECCGFLIGRVDVDRSVRRVEKVEIAVNEVGADRHRRFVIDPEKLASLEEELEPSGLTVLGFYHSHPDHPARPSSFDSEHAWPWYTYVVLNVEKGRAGEIGAFELDPDRREFTPVRLTLLQPMNEGDGAPPTAGRVDGSN
jgi:proteasome lid subunit RPN8/RPN11